MSDEPELGYAEAMAELQQILIDLEDDRLDIDQLGDKAARAQELITVCRDRISVARARVDQIVAQLDPDEDDGATS